MLLFLNIFIFQIYISDFRRRESKFREFLGLFGKVNSLIQNETLKEITLMIKNNLRQREKEMKH
jgi:hypothetical protein